MAEKQRILIVDDDKNICELLRLYLEKEEYDTRLAYDGAEAFEVFEQWQPDLILLDVMMPKQDGNETCRKIRAVSKVPIIMVTAKGETFDKVLGLELGADDYIVKPLEMKEVVARIKAVLRRTGDTAASTDDSGQKVVQFENLRLDLAKYELEVCGKVVEAPPKEMELLYFLASHPDRMVTRDQLVDEVWGIDYYGYSRTIDVHVKRLREKLEGASEKWEIETVWSKGYKFKVHGG